MLHEFLLAERDEILALCARKLLNSSDSNGRILKSADANKSSVKMGEGLPLFYDELIDVLIRAEQDTSTRAKEATASEYIDRNTANQHGEEALRLGYTISQVVHGYGSICQGITEYAQQKDEPITVREFSYLNLCLDIAIAESVTAYDRVQRETIDRDEVQRLGFLAHELRNALSNATMSFQVIKNGTVGVGGNTSRVLEKGLERMRDLIDRSLTEVRLRSYPTVERQRSRVLLLVNEVEAAASAGASAKYIQFSIEVAPDLEIYADLHFMVSALGNLVQNAIKFTKLGSMIWIRAREEGHRVIIEIEDQCGGLPTDRIEGLFHPFTQMDADRTGVGLGLAICKQAITLNEGSLSARDVPGKGCIFTIDLPRADDLQWKETRT